MNNPQESVPERVRIRAGVTATRILWFSALLYVVINLFAFESTSTWLRIVTMLGLVLAALATGIQYFQADSGGITRMQWWGTEQTLPWADVESIEISVAAGWTRFVQPGTEVHAVGRDGTRIAATAAVRGKELFDGRRRFVAMAKARGIPVHDHRRTATGEEVG